MTPEIKILTILSIACAYIIGYIAGKYKERKANMNTRAELMEYKTKEILLRNQYKYQNIEEEKE